MPNSHIFIRRIEYKFRVVFVYCVVCEVHTHILHIIESRHDVSFSSKTSQALIIQIDSQRVDTCQQNIYSEVKFQPVHQIWLMQIPLYNEMLP